ncbi:hypothetical protein EF912_05415 [Streptomyces sp. WAC07061]|uniref:hypothetical protein n=1 Tax=Streptomyces sp. WAC07061 TaxID=2487410 RepID=UPI000F7A9552|nr:hypothetical protein [Streptomyces sp. WAC07061]RSS62220.1 hypothetical protein EF912_05415 [Streptomyces sp. WAC07061]
MGWASWTTRSVVAGRGGVRTTGAGVLTGELEVRTDWSDGLAYVAVRPRGGSAWHTVAGSPVPCPNGYASRRLHDSFLDSVRGRGTTTLADVRPPVGAGRARERAAGRPVLSET